MHAIGQMSLYEFFLMFAVMALLGTVYMAYWTAYCWAWHFVWPTGPQWLVSPHPLSFLLVSITGVTITLMILSRIDG